MNKEYRAFISVIMATFNEPPKFIEDSISSILNQTYPNFELLIADDSTNNDTINVINDFANKDKRVVVIRKEERMGFVNALNVALDLAKGDFIARMDGDDISLPERFDIQLKYAEEHPEVDFFSGDVYMINERGDVISERTFPTTPKRIERRLIYRSPLSHPVLMFRRKILDAGFRYNPEYKKAEDLDFYLRLYKNGYVIGNTGTKLLKARVVGDTQKKRGHSQWYYNHRARTENFIWRKPLFSSASWFISLLYILTPSFIMTFFYSKENLKKQ